MSNEHDRGRGFHPIWAICAWSMDDAHKWRRWLMLALAALLAWILCAAVTMPHADTNTDAAPRTDTIQPATGDEATAGADATGKTREPESAGGETNRHAADRVTAAMNTLLESTPDGRTRLVDTVQPGGQALTDDLAQAEQQVTDLLKQAYASPDATGLDASLDQAYAAWESQVWLIANNDKLRNITSTLMHMSEQVTRIEDMNDRPADCDPLIRIAHTLPEAGNTLESYQAAHQWILDYNDAYSACTVALQREQP